MDLNLTVLSWVPVKKKKYACTEAEIRKHWVWTRPVYFLCASLWDGPFTRLKKPFHDAMLHMIKSDYHICTAHYLKKIGCTLFKINEADVQIYDSSYMCSQN